MNAIGQRSTVNQTGSAYASTRSIAWGYDALGQVTSADSSENAHDRAYQYDAIGNRLEARDGVTAVTGTPNYTANALNQYTAANSFTPTYDDDGNQQNAQIRPLGSSSLTACVYHWDAENRLIAIHASTGSLLASYQYDAQSRRIAKNVPGQASTLTVYDAWNPIAEYALGASQYSLRTTYTWGLDLSGSLQGAGGVGGLLSVTSHSSQGTSHYPTYDGNGNVSEYLNNSGSIAAHYEYDAFGNVVLASGSTPEAFAHRFSTKPQDAESGLNYYGYRYYDPITGRWPSRDPIGERGGVNLNVLTNNNGVQKYDVLGLVSRARGLGQRNDSFNINLILKGYLYYLFGQSTYKIGIVSVDTFLNCSDAGDLSGGWQVANAWVDTSSVSSTNIPSLADKKGTFDNKNNSITFQGTASKDDLLFTAVEGAAIGAGMGFAYGAITGGPAAAFSGFVGGAVTGAVGGVIQYSMHAPGVTTIDVTYVAKCVCHKGDGLWDPEMYWSPEVKGHFDVAEAGRLTWSMTGRSGYLFYQDN